MSVLGFVMFQVVALYGLYGCRSKPSVIYSDLALPGSDKSVISDKYRVFNNNPFDSFVARNENRLFRGELSGIGFRNSPSNVGDSKLCVTLITPKHAITAGHTTPTASIEYRFIGTDGNPYIGKTIAKPRSESTFTNKITVPITVGSYVGKWSGTIDVGIVEFENPLPDVVKPLKIWSGETGEELKNRALDVWMYGFTVTNFLIAPAVIGYESQLKLNFTRTTSDAWLISGDSGSPTLYYDESNRETYIMGVHVSGGGGRTSNYAGYDAFVGHPVVRNWLNSKIDFSRYAVDSSSVVNKNTTNTNITLVQVPNLTNYTGSVTNYLKVKKGEIWVIQAE